MENKTEVLESINKKLNEVMNEYDFFARINKNKIEYTRVLNKQIYQLIEVSYWNNEIPGEELRREISVEINIKPICVHDLSKIEAESFFIEDIMADKLENCRADFMDYTEKNLDLLIKHFREYVIPTLNEWDTYKKIYRETINVDELLFHVFSAETKLWLYFVCDEYYEHYNECINYAKEIRITREENLNHCIEEKYDYEYAKWLKKEIPELRKIEELFSNYKIDELKKIVKQNEEKNLKKIIDIYN